MGLAYVDDAGIPQYIGYMQVLSGPAFIVVSTYLGNSVTPISDSTVAYNQSEDPIDIEMYFDGDHELRFSNGIRFLAHIDVTPTLGPGNKDLHMFAWSNLKISNAMYKEINGSYDMLVREPNEEFKHGIFRNSVTATVDSSSTDIPANLQNTVRTANGYARCYGSMNIEWGP